MITRIWFETHSTTLDNEAGIASGWRPGELSELGRERAAALGIRIRDRSLDAVYCSDLARAVQTASTAFAQAGVDLPLLLDWRLRECDYGRLNGTPSADVHDDRLRYAQNPYPGGESWEQATRRAAAGVRDAATRHPGGTIMIIGHIATGFGVRRACGATDSLATMITGRSPWKPGRLYEIAL
ncbi:fructose 1,6-bisphosphatase [Microlunatus endophyticus]|uniref:Fructose 1,6-bisphosphatase n=1 Tax=Microlunatus endophyticus TaxID=1716077 RepID=A0A917S4U2_9ACTN|nr:histidine phosphatase family protein [Microlunatus endophyticus]GGL58432.1 fructose 1,6-bisphosphatase [Microlunatus endophyticus]